MVGKSKQSSFPACNLPHKISAKHQALSYRMVHDVKYNRNSEIRRRQLVLAQRRSREKSRMIKSLSKFNADLAEEIKCLEKIYHEQLLCHQSTIVSRFLAFLDQFTLNQSRDSSSLNDAELFSESIMFGEAHGRGPVRDQWLQWTKQTSLVVQSSETICTNDTLDFILQVRVQLLTHAVVGEHCEPRTVEGIISAYFNGDDGLASLLQIDTNNFQTFPWDTNDNSLIELGRIDSKADSQVSKWSLEYILHQS